MIANLKIQFYYLFFDLMKFIIEKLLQINGISLIRNLSSRDSKLINIRPNIKRKNFKH